MVLSRFFYVVLAVALAVSLFLLYLATNVSNRQAQRTSGSLLIAASRAVGWYLNQDARTRATALIRLSVDPDVQAGLEAAGKAERLKDVDGKLAEKVRAKLKAFRKDQAAASDPIEFDVLWAVDVHGRVLANENFERGTSSPEFEMGGYPLVADALHGWIRDDAWVFDGRIHRVVARPVETQVQGVPVGCVVGAKVVDDRFAQAISDSTGAAVAFYSGETRVATGAPPSFDKAALEVHSADLQALAGDPDYSEKGRSGAKVLRHTAGFDTTAVFARLPGEAWDLGAGYVVGHRQPVVRDPLELQRNAEEGDKAAVPIWMIVLVGVGAALLGLALSFLEHTLPLFGFRRALADLADKKSPTDVLKPSTFRGVFKKIAVLVNDALDKAAAGAGVDRGPADLERVVGPLPAQPQMSAFAAPSRPAGAVQGAAQGATQPEARRHVPKAQPRAPASGGPVAAQSGMPAGDGAGQPLHAQPPPRAAAGAPPPYAAPAVLFPPLERPLGPAPAAAPVHHAPPSPFHAHEAAPAPPSPRHAANVQAPPGWPGAAPAAAPEHSGPPPVSYESDLPPASGPPGPPPDVDEETEWRQVYAEFIALKKRLGEPVERLTYEKFKGTLQRNKDALVARHGCTVVKFRVYEKQGRAALKASPVK